MYLCYWPSTNRPLTTSGESNFSAHQTVRLSYVATLHRGYVSVGHGNRGITCLIYCPDTSEGIGTTKNPLEWNLPPQRLSSDYRGRLEFAPSRSSDMSVFPDVDILDELVHIHPPEHHASRLVHARSRTGRMMLRRARTRIGAA